MRVTNSVNKVIDRVNKMIKHGLSDDKVAWFLLLNTKVARWEQAKEVAKELRDEYDK
jgi:hypothetical protein